MGGLALGAAFLDDGELGGAEGVGLGKRRLFFQMAEEALHELGGLVVRDAPERGDDVAGAGELEGLPEAGHPLAVVHRAETGLASAEDDQLGAAQVDAEDFQAGEDAVIVALGDQLVALVGAGQDQSAADQGVLQGGGFLAGLPLDQQRLAGFRQHFQAPALSAAGPRATISP